MQGPPSAIGQRLIDSADSASPALLLRGCVPGWATGVPALGLIDPPLAFARRISGIALPRKKWAAGPKGEKRAPAITAIYS
jgi:hypothetical protein